MMRERKGGSTTHAAVGPYLSLYLEQGLLFVTAGLLCEVPGILLCPPPHLTVGMLGLQTLAATSGFTWILEMGTQIVTLAQQALTNWITPPHPQSLSFTLNGCTRYLLVSTLILEVVNLFLEVLLKHKYLLTAGLVYYGTILCWTYLLPLQLLLLLHRKILYLFCCLSPRFDLLLEVSPTNTK